MKIAFRVDSSDLIGAGHIRRCLKLAEDLKYKSKKIIFITKNLNGNFNNLIKKKGIKVILIKNNTLSHKLSNDLEVTKYICRKFKINILIIDNYKIGINWEKKIKRYVDKLMVIDDFTKKEHSCDIIINNFNIKNNDKTKYFNGLEYVIIPSDCIQKKRGKIKKQKKKIVTIGTFFGSTDSSNSSEVFLKIFSQKEFNKLKFISILGKNNKNKKKIKENFKKYKNLYIEKNFIKMKNFFNQIDILISSGGVTSFEATCSNIKCINVPINFYQKMSSNFQKKSKIANILSYEKVIRKNGKRLLIQCLKKVSKENNFSEKKLYLDGQGSKRISEILIPSKFSEVSFKKAKNSTDCVDLFKLYNEKETIKNSFSRKRESFENHLKWFKKKIFSQNSYIYIFRIKDLCVGQVRIDITKRKIGLIDYSINRIFRGRGWGKLILAQAMNVINKSKNINHFQARVKKTNLKSLKIFRNLFFLRKNKKKYIEFNKSVAFK